MVFSKALTDKFDCTLSTLRYSKSGVDIKYIPPYQSKIEIAFKGAKGHYMVQSVVILEYIKTGYNRKKKHNRWMLTV